MSPNERLNHKSYAMILCTVVSLGVLVVHPELWLGVLVMLAMMWVPVLIFAIFGSDR